MKVLSNDGKVKETFHLEDGKSIIQREHDVTGILEANKFLRGEQTMRHQSEVMNHVAHIDMNAIEIWCKVRGITVQTFFVDPKVLQNFLNDPDNKAWRTRTGKI